uniref:Transmembrane protein n=1 Tax=Heterorhabditis bacteriophora TaxID=37862 RepID=A0A1I7W667_HETBA
MPTSTMANTLSTQQVSLSSLSSSSLSSIRTVNTSSVDSQSSSPGVMFLSVVLFVVTIALIIKIIISNRKRWGVRALKISSLNFIVFHKKITTLMLISLKTTTSHRFKIVAHFIKICVYDKKNNNQWPWWSPTDGYRHNSDQQEFPKDFPSDSCRESESIVFMLLSSSQVYSASTDVDCGTILLKSEANTWKSLEIRH